MTTRLISKQLISQNENSEAHPKKAVVDGTRNKISKTTTKKGGTGLGNRKALNNITNKATVHHEASIRKKNLPKEEFIHADEKFLHDHKKCIEAHQQNALEPNFLETVFPGHGNFASHPRKPINTAKNDIDNLCCYPELVELPMLEFNDRLGSSQNSFSSSSIHWDSPPSSPLACRFAPVDFLLKQEEAVVDGRNKFSKTTIKKGGGGLGNRNALNDITNKSAIHHEASTGIKNLPKEEFKYADEKFLHDHKKCVQAQKKALEPNFFETVFPGYDFASRFEKPIDKANSDIDNLYCCSEPVELPILEFCDWLKPLRNSDSSSPIRWDSPPSSPLAWNFAPVEFLLKQEIDD